MQYNWQQTDWPDFKYNLTPLREQLALFSEKVGKIKGLLEGLSEDIQLETILSAMVSEAINTSSIEGEFLSRVDVISSIKNNLGLHPSNVSVKDQRAKGIGQMIAHIRASYNEPLNTDYLFELHQMLLLGNKTINVGSWRSSLEPMRVVSGTIGKETIHFEAPPSSKVPFEMQRFIKWFNETIISPENTILETPVRSAIAHVYFETIHPFEDGNGRIGRALSEKAIYQGIGSPIPISLSKIIESDKQSYYLALQEAQRSNEITAWLRYFVNTTLKAQEASEKEILFTLKKTQFFDRIKAHINIRQEKVLRKMLGAGPDGFQGGMNVKKYRSITRVSKATATRDLQALVAIGVFIPIGGGRSTRYDLSMNANH